jgi:hypothetical protein
MDLKMGLSRVQSAYLMARRAGAPQKILDLLQMLMVRANQMLTAGQAQAPTQAQMAALPFQAGIAAPGGVVGGPPGVPPIGAPGAPPAAAPAAA